MTIPLTESFDGSTGEFVNYDSYQTVDRANIDKLKHRDVRVMQQADITSGQTVLALSAFPMSVLEGQTMTQLEGTTTQRKGEAWSGGTVASDPARNNWRILSLSLIVGTTTASSVVTDVLVDLLTDFVDTDSISVAFPTFPAGVTQASSFIDLTSHPTGDFSTGPTASVALSASTVAMSAGSAEFRAPRSAFNQSGIDLSKITGVRLRIASTGVNTMRVAAIRLLPSAWTMGTLGADTRYGRLRRGIPRNGDPTTTGFTWPILWRSQAPPSSADPKPIDGEVAVMFNTGSMGASNAVTLYFREVTEDFMTMLDLDGVSMAELNGRIMPDVGTAKYNSRTMSDLDQFTYNELTGETMFDLERKPDYTSASWISFTLTWSALTTQIQMGNTETGNVEASGNYTFAAPILAANTNYVWFATIEENQVRSTLYAVTALGGTGTLIYDTTTVIDDSAFHRRKGRFGWFASLGDGDAMVDSINARTMTYAEYRSLPFESNTPVIGAELFFSGSPNLEHYQSFVPGPYNSSDTVVARDGSRSTTGESWRVENLGTNPVQGLKTNLFALENFEDTEVEFDLWYPDDGTTLPIAPYLISESGRIIQLRIPLITPNQWQHIRTKLPRGQTVLTGNYSFVLLQLPAVVSTWWVDNASIFTRAIEWAGRAVVNDPWNANDAPWTPFLNTLNREGGGIVFPRRGTKLQVQAKARVQEAHIDRIQFRPRYAELGRFKPTGVTVPRVAPIASFTSAAAGTATLKLTSTSTDADGVIVSNEWNFGDGTSGTGAVVVHTYPAAGTYTVTLVSMDNNGNRGVTSGPVTA